MRQVSAEPVAGGDVNRRRRRGRGKSTRITSVPLKALANEQQSGTSAPAILRAPAPLSGASATMWPVTDVDTVRLGDLTLRRPTMADAAAFHAVESDERVWWLYPHLCPSSRAETDAKLAWMIGHWDEHGFGTWVAEWDGVVVGTGGPRFHDQDGEPVVNIYYRLSPEAQGRGIATSIVDATLDIAAQVAPGLAVVIRTHAQNGPARRVAEKHGFVYVGDEPGEDHPLVVYRREGEPAERRVSEND